MTAKPLLSKPGVRAGIATLLVLASSSLMAGTVTLPTRPLGLPQTDVKPNLIMALDDSGSMDFELLLPDNDGAAWWHYNNAAAATCPLQTFLGCAGDGVNDTPVAGVFNFYSQGTQNTTWRKYAYLFPNGSATGARVLTDGTVDHFAIPPTTNLAFFRAPDFNKSYFDPTKQYDPWLSRGTGTFGNSTPSAAKTDPTQGSLTFDVTSDRASDTSVSTDPVLTPCVTLGLSGGITTGTLGISGTAANHTFHLFAGMTLPAGTCFYDLRTTTVRVNGRNVTSTNGWSVVPIGDYTVAAGDANDGQSVGIRYFPATFYLISPSSVTGATTLPAGYGYTATPATVTIPALSFTDPASGTVTTVTQLLRYEIKPANFSSTAAYNTAIQNFANWFTYYRKRHEALRGGVGIAFDGTTRLRLGSYTINNRTNVSMLDMSVASNRTSFYDTLYNFSVSGGTPNREAVAYAVDQFNRTGTGAPITDACQKNFGMLFTDGFSNASTATIGGSTVGNQDLNQGALFTDNQSNTMADLTMYGYKNTLRTDLATGLVSPDSACATTSSSSTAYSKLDCQRNLHMGFYGITLGGKGVTFGVNQTQTNDPYNNIPTWPTTFTDRNPTAVDDLWHAALNARGQLLLATTPKDISDKFKSILNNISAKTGDAAAVALNSGAVQSGNRLYQAFYNSGDWTGRLNSSRISVGGGASTDPCNSLTRGATCAVDWEAGSLISPTGRVVLTMNDTTRTGMAFTAANLTTNQRTLLNYNLGTGSTNDGNAALRVAYLRGDQSQEAATATPKLRNRSSLLGDIVDSDPFYYGAPPYSYAFSGYQTFKSNNANRTPYVYVAANDGMLHAFRADTGVEGFAYIPTKAYGSVNNSKYPLASYTDPNYTHLFINDGSPIVGDVYYGSAWHSLLVNSLRSGGQGLYGLDVTNPSNFSEANAASIVNWEFTDADDADLGYVYGRPTIARLRDGNFYVIFSSGYNNTEADGRASTTGKGAIYLLKASGPTGSNGAWTLNTDYYKIVLNAGTVTSPDGVGIPYVVDTNNDDKADYIYVGDQLGNLWRTSLTSSTPSDWVLATNTVAIASAVDPLDATIPQPITMQPIVGFNLLTPTNQTDLVVYFGTGSYIDATDGSYASTNRTQTFYAVVDSLAASPTAVTRAGLVQQKIVKEVGSGGAACVSTTSTAATGCYRQTTTNAVQSTDKGWYIDLYNTNNGAVTAALAQSTGSNQGERAVTHPSLQEGFIYFNTLIPGSGSSNCGSSGTGWLMVLDAKTGKMLSTPVLDTNNDGSVDSNDLTVSGAKYGSILSSLSFIQSSNTIKKIKCGLGSGEQCDLNTRAGGREGRVSWREIVPANN